jgi:hypothetical protein
VARQIQQAIDLGHRHFLRTALEAFDRVAGSDFLLLEYPEVETRPAVCDEQRGHARLVHPDAEAIARDPRLADLEQRRADLVAVTDADLVVRETLHGEVLAELPVGEIVAAEKLLPVAIGLDLVDEHRAVDATVPLQVALAIAVDVKAADRPATADGVLPDAGVDSSPLPANVPGRADVDRQEPASGGKRHYVPAFGRIPGVTISPLLFTL